MPGAGIRFDRVTIRYRGTVALDDFSLAVDAGTIMALLGPSGSGKTTALRSLAGFAVPASGRLFLGDRDVTGLPARDRGIGVVVQQYALFPHMRVTDNVAFGLRARRAGPRSRGAARRRAVQQRVTQMLDLVGMAGYARRYPHELSGGQQQRVAIARALAPGPRVLLFDEPLSALDARLRGEMLAEISRLHRELPDLTILYVTHDQVEALTLADHIAVLRDGRLVDTGTARELYERPPSEFTADFIGSANLLPVIIEPSGTAEPPRAGAGAGRAWVRFGRHRLLVTVSRAPGPGAGNGTGQRQMAGAETHPEHTRTLCIRPHSLTLAAAGNHDNSIPATVKHVQWRGPSYRIVLGVAGTELRADLPAGLDPPRPADEVRVGFAASEAVLLAGSPDDGAGSRVRHAGSPV